MSSPLSPIWDGSRSFDLTSRNLTAQQTHRWVSVQLAFVALGILLRIVRYLMDYPLWWDEAFVAVNFIRRDYLDLLRPLDYGQVCPILFLWFELALVRLLGFSEWSLRLFPLICAIASVVLFKHVARRLLHGLALVMAVAIFATSYHPILHAADVKPYASDLLSALLLLAMAVEWWRVPERAGWMWALAALAPVAIATSHPAVFVATGTVIGLCPSVVKTRQREVWRAYAAFGLSTIGAFVGLYFVFTRAQSSANLAAMQAQWAAAFPPLDDASALCAWLVTVHTGSTFAYPCGGERGASSLTFLLFAVGAGVLWFRGRRVMLLICVAPFGMAIAAAAMKRYPYGGPVAHGSPARVMQYLAPAICMLTGLGSAVVLTLCRNTRRRQKVIRVVLVGLAAVGVMPVAVESLHPYRSIHAERAREFARKFWPDFVRDAEPICLRWDLGIGPWDSTNLNVAVYLCNQMIYSPRRRQQRESSSQTTSENRPLRCVSPLADLPSSQVAAWLGAMDQSYQLTSCRTLAVDMAAPNAKPRTELYRVYEFMPRDGGRLG